MSNITKIKDKETGVIYPIEDSEAREDISELRSALDDAIEDFAVPTQEAVDNWLNEHPEATTTVQDDSLTEAKFTNDLKLKTVKDYVTPQMYGAVGDGTTDDTSAFNQALNSGKKVFIPQGNYYISTALNNPINVVICGVGAESNIKCGSSFLANEINSSLIKDIRIYCDENAENLTAFPSYITQSLIQNIRVKFFDSVFFSLRTCTIVDSCYFTFIKSSFARNVVDSFITKNYINSPKLTNPQGVCFSRQVVNSVISNNFFDYWFKVFECESMSYMKRVAVTGNVFDVCYAIFYNAVSGVAFTGNTISNLKKRNDWDVSGNSEMDTENWSVIKRKTASKSVLVNSIFQSNSFDGFADFDMYLDCVSENGGYPTYDFVIDEALPASKFNFSAYKSGNTRDSENIMIKPMLKRTVSSLPQASLTGKYVSFNNDEVIYNGNWYINIDGTWVQITSV